MYLKYGNTTLNRGSAGIVITQEPVMSNRREIWAHDVIADIEIMLTSTKSTLAQMTADIKAQTNAVAIAFRKNFQDLRYLHLNGTASHIVLLNSQCLGGVRILKPPSWPDSKGAEHVTKRTIRLSIGGRVPVPTSELTSALHSFTEECRFEPAGAKFGHIETLQTKPVKQLLRQHQVYRATQTGSAVGLYDYPVVAAIAPPIWPVALVDQEPLIIKGHPEVIGDDHMLFPISWTWMYESATRLSNGGPRIWRAGIQ